MPLRNRNRNTIPAYRVGGGQAPFEFGNALEFDGVNDFVSVSRISINTGTISFWVKTDETTIYCLSQADTNTSYFAFRPNSTSVYVRFINTFLNFSVSTLNVDTWYHVFLRFDGSGARLYINGVESSSGKLSNSENFIIDQLGRRYTTTIYSKFIIDEVAIWNTDIGNESANLYNSGNGDYATNYSNANLIRYWRCNEADGATTLVDSKGNGNGTLNNFSTPPAYFIPH